jgi:ataxia telangiectasia mutated family protein
LSVRNYIVVPLSPTAGVIEFVEGTISIQEWLMPLKPPLWRGGFTRYAEDGAGLELVERVREKFHNTSTTYHNMPRTAESRQKILKVFRSVTARLKPVLRYFFIESFKNSGDWFSSRLRFCRHMATNSMVGYLLGIGDRHLNNILLDRSTAELVHIDLGLAFDQGLALAVPERVPFRLTGNMVDGMGWKGKEGVFRRACEESLAVLRSKGEYLLTVLDVLMNDPLHTWTVVPRKQRGLASMAVDGGAAAAEIRTKTAESVMMTCKKKLEGREIGELMSVEGQVARLISEAEDEENLAFMYHGWKPYI